MAQGWEGAKKNGHHGKAPVLDLLHLELRKGIGVVGQAQGVERATRVQAVQVGAEVPNAATRAVRLGSAHDHQLGDEDQNNGLGVHQVGVAQVVQPVSSEDGSTGLEPHRALAERHAVVGQDLWDEHTHHTQHGPAGVDHLGLTVLGQSCRVRAQTSGVPAIVTSKLASEV